jgi:hypothetical protein
MVRRLLLSAVCGALVTVALPSVGHAGGLPGQVRIDKLVEGPGPASGYEVTIACESVTLPPEPIEDGDTLLIPVPWDEECEVTETVTLGASVTYTCQTGGAQDPCTGDNTFEIFSQDPVTAIITITNSFAEPVPSDTTASTTTTAPVAAAATRPSFTG